MEFSKNSKGSRPEGQLKISWRAFSPGSGLANPDIDVSNIIELIMYGILTPKGR